MYFILLSTGKINQTHLIQIAVAWNKHMPYEFIYQ